MAVDARARAALAGGAGDAGSKAARSPASTGRWSRPDEKLALFAQTRAGAADMESHVVARAASAAGVPFVVLRVVSDPSNRMLPRAAVVGITEDGRIDGRAVAASLLRGPWECFDLMTLALDGAQAMRRLRRVGRRLASLLLNL